MVLVVIILLIVPAIFVIPSDAYITRPRISCTDLGPSNVEVQIPMNTSKKVQFPLNISVSNPDNVDLTVSISFAVGEGWDIRVTPGQMTFNTSGWQKAMITVIVPGNLTKKMMVRVWLEVSGVYPNMTTPPEDTHFDYIFIEPHHSLAVTYQFTHKDQYLNTIEFSIANKGFAYEWIQQNFLLHNQTDDNLDANFETRSGSNFIYPKDPPSKIVLVARYKGSKFPMTYEIEVRFFPVSNISKYYVSFNLTLSYSAQERTQQTYLLVGTIVAFVIVMVVVMVVVLRGPGKGKK
jgi:hypothetical protein